MAAEFHRHPLHVRAGDRRKLLADGGGAGERHLADDRVRDEVLGNLRRHAIDQVHHARRHAGIGEAADQFGRRGRRLLRRLDDDRAAGGQRAGQLAHHLVDREVPRREGRDRPHRLLHHELIDALCPRGNDAAIGAARLLGEPVDHVRAGQHLALGLGQRLALLHGQQRCDGVRTIAQQVGRLAHHLRAIECGNLAPEPEALCQRPPVHGRGRRARRAPRCRCCRRWPG